MAVKKPNSNNTLLTLLSINAISSMSTDLSMAFIPVYANVLGSSSLMIGLISAAYMGASAVANPSWGWVSDRLLKRKRFILLGLVVSSFFYAMTVLVTSDVQLLALRILQGVSFAAYNIALVTMLSESATEMRQGRTMGFYGGAQAAGVTIALLSGGWVALQFGITSIFMASAVLFFANCISALALLREPLIKFEGKPEGNPLNMIRMILTKSDNNRGIRNPRNGLLHVYLVWIVRNAGMAGIFVFLPLYVIKLGGDYASIGTLLAVQMAPQILFMPLFGKLAEKVNKRRILLFGCTLTLVGQLLLSFCSSYFQLILVMPFFSVAFSALLTGATTHIVESTSSNERGVALGLFNSAYYIADAVGPVTAAVVLQTLGNDYGLMFRVAAAFSVFALIIAATIPKQLSKNAQHNKSTQI